MVLLKKIISLSNFQHTSSLLYSSSDYIENRTNFVCGTSLQLAWKVSCLGSPFQKWTFFLLGRLGRDVLEPCHSIVWGLCVLKMSASSSLLFSPSRGGGEDCSGVCCDDSPSSSINGNTWNRPVTRCLCSFFKGEVHSRMAIYFLYANKKFIQKYVIHQNFSFQRALNPYEIFL